MKENIVNMLLNVQFFLDNGYSFFIPRYQRGYRWTQEQAERLIQDLYEFELEENKKGSTERCPFYSMQVLVVEQRDQKIMDTEDYHDFEVIDGQQRLTTMLILRQALHIVKNIISSNIVEIVIKHPEHLLPQKMYQIKYDTRTNSKEWLKELTLAYLKDFRTNSHHNIEAFKNKNRDYNHFAEVLEVGINYFQKYTNCNWENVLTNVARFIWYDKSKVLYEDKNELIFNRLNATKIKLNNAELIKALFLQEGVYKTEGFIRRDQMAIDWDELEKKLQNPEFWMFICPSKIAKSYSTHIEYLFDMLQGKTENERDRENYTFDCYYNGFQKAKNKYEFVQEKWKEVMDMYQVLQEWYEEKHTYHLIGYLLEYGKENDVDITVPKLIEKLYIDYDTKEMQKKSQWIGILKKLVRDSIANIKPHQLVYHRPELTQILFLFNILQEDKKTNPNARFSFNSYKRIALGLDDGIVWHQEHVASHSDFTPILEKRQELARDLLEYFTGIDIPKQTIKEESPDSVKRKYDNGICILSKKEKELCKKLLTLFDELPSENEQEKEDKEKELVSIFAAVNKYFEADDPLLENIPHGKGIKSEKDFIWNFVLLNSRTNMSYGNSIFPIKRKRILKDDSEIFTMIGTRNVFEKIYSKRLSNMLTWGRKDAYEYWNEITNTLDEFLPNNFNLPEYIKYEDNGK